METGNIIINVGRQLGSGGRMIAKMLAQNFGYRFYDREILNLAARESGFSERFFEQNDEQKMFGRSFLNYHLPLMGDHHFYSNNNFSQERLFQFQSDAIRKAALESNCVFVGRCADYVLRALKVDKGQHQVEKGAALIVEVEERRAAYYNYYTGKRWGQAASYHLCVNSSILGMEGTAELLGDFVRRRFQQP